MKYSNVVIPPESNFIIMIFRHYPKCSVDNNQDLEKLINIIFRDFKFNDWNINRATIREIKKKELPISINNFILTICQIYRDHTFPDSEMFGFKKGNYLDFCDEIKEIFPKSKFIGIIRDGRAVFNSKKKSIASKTGLPIETNPLKAALRWCKVLNMLRDYEKKYDDILIIYFKDIIKKPNETVNKSIEFLNVSDILEISPKEKKYIIPVRYKDLHKNIEENPILCRISAWKKSLSKDELYAFESIAYNYLISEGYPLINSRISLKNPIKKIIIYLTHKKWRLNKRWFIKYLLLRFDN